MQYYVVFFDDFCNLVPENWINVESNEIFWPPKHVKFNKHKMHNLQPKSDWLTYECRKRLGPFETIHIANQIEEHCINASTNDDTDEICTKPLLNEAEKKRHKKKPAFYDDTSEEEQETERCKDKCATNSVRLPPSHYEQQNFDQHKTFLTNTLSLDLQERNETNMLECESSSISIEVENNNVLEKSFVQDENLDSTLVHKSTENTILQKQTSTYSRKKACIEKVEDVNRPIENLLRSSKQRRIEATTFSEPMTEERFQKYYKGLNTKLNHIINLLKDHSTDIRSSNVSVSNLYNDDTMMSVASTSSSSSVLETEAKKKRRSSELNEAILMKLTSLLDAPLPPQPELVLPPLPAMPPQNDEIENVIGLVRAALNRIPLSKRHECIVELLTFLYSSENSYK